MLASNCVDSRRDFRTEPLATSSVDVHGEPMIEGLDVGYCSPTSRSGRSSNPHLSPFKAVMGGSNARNRTGGFRAEKRPVGKRPIADVAARTYESVR